MTFLPSARPKFAIFLLLLIDLVVPVKIIWDDLNGELESVGGFILLLLVPIGILIHLLVVFPVGRRLFAILQQRTERTKALSTTIWAIGLWSILLIFIPGYVTKTIGPAYDAYMIKRSTSNLKTLESFYKEPTYLPSQIKFIKKTLEKQSWAKDEYERILTGYSCKELNSPSFGSVSISVAFFRGRYNLENPETIKISDKEAVFVGDSHLVLYDGEVTREVYGTYGCGDTKEDLIKIMQSLQPVQFVPGTDINFGSAYHLLD
ncbi:MAG: hypothetical protein WCT44_00600 [Candidatus Paceibacterota bacterium]